MVNDKNLEAVRNYLTIHKEEIIDGYHAAGVGIGKINSNDDSYAIVVYLNDKQPMPEQGVKMDGISIKFEATGNFVLHH